MASLTRQRFKEHPPHALPPRPLQFVGLTWVDRGPAYWLRRAGTTLFWFLAAAVTGAMAVAVIVTSIPDGTTVLAVALGVYALLCGGAACIVTRHIRTVDRFGTTGAGSREQAGLDGRRSVVARAATALTPVFMVLAIPLALGAVLPFFIRSFGRYSVGERYERRRAGLSA